MDKTDDDDVCRNRNYLIDSSQIIKKYQLSVAYKYAEAQRQCIKVPLIDTRLNYVKKDLTITNEWCPLPVILYSHTEDCNPSVRVDEFVKLTKKGVQQSTLPTINYISSDEAQIQYLESNPVCFFVCGKPGLGQEMVARDLAKYWNCCYLDPVTALEQEIESKTRTGRFIEYNLRSGRAIGGDIIINIIKQLVQSSSSRHKGFVLSGLPLIPNDLYDDDEPLASEAAVYVAEQILDSLLTTVTQKPIQLESKIEEEILSPCSTDVELPMNELGSLVSSTSYLGKSQKFDFYSSLKNQLNDVLNCFQLPFIIIYLKSSINEILMRRDKLRYDIQTNRNVNLSNIYIETLLSSNRTIHFKRLAKEVRNFACNVRDEIDHYVKYVQPILDKFVLNHDQQYVITIDARLPLHEINEVIKCKINTLPLQKVISVEKFSDVIKPLMEEEVEEEEAEEEEKDQNGKTLGNDASNGDEKILKIDYDFTDKTVEDVFKDFQNVCTIRPRYRWQLSHWDYKCPVALRHGRIVTGKPTNAVRFMNHIYFLENQHAICLFTRNPRPYLLPPNPQCPGQIYIFGIENCGARDVALCLSYVYNLYVIDIALLHNEIKEKMKYEAIETYRSSLIEEYYNNLYQEAITNWELDTSEVDKKRQQWLESILKLYATYQYQENELMQRTVLYQIKKENPLNDDVLEESVTESDDHDSMLHVNQIEETLHSLGVPSDTFFITEALENPGILFKYIPEQYARTPKPEKRQDIEINADKLQQINELTEIYKNEQIKEDDFVVSEELIIPVILSRIHDMEAQKAKNEQTKNKKKNGWIIVNAKTASLVSSLYESGVVPYTVVYLYDDDVDNKFLIKKYARKHFSDYHLMQDFLYLNGFESAAERCAQNGVIVNQTQIYMDDANDFIDDMLQNERFKYVDKLKMINGNDLWIEQEIVKTKKNPHRLSSSTIMGGEGSILLSNMSNNLFTIIEEFDNEWDQLSVFFAKINVRPIDVKFACAIEDVMLDAIRLVNSQFRMHVKDFDEEERGHELAMNDLSINMEEEVEEEIEEDDRGSGVEMLTRNLGDTLHYCPIALLKHNVLWKGKNELGVMYENKLYFFSSEYAKQLFMLHPSQFVPFRYPIQYLPPLRICVIGPIASGKTTISKLLAKQLGVIYVNFLDNITKQSLPSFIKVGRKNQDAYITENDTLKSYDPSDKEEQLFNAFYLYFDGKSPLPSKYLNRLLPRLWQHEPYSACGVILDGFPFSVTDFEYMANNYIIPDVIINLRIRLSTAIQRTLDELLDQWKRQKLEILQKKTEELEKQIKEWKIERQKLYDRLMEERIQQRVNTLINSTPSESTQSDDTKNDIKAASLEAAIMEAKRIQDDDKRDVLEEVDLELPIPEMEDDLETKENAEIRLMQFIEDTYADENVMLQSFQSMCEEHSIPYIEVNANRSTQCILLELLYKLDSFKMRNESFLEKTYPITLDEATRLLNVGYYLLSNYGYLCPVQMYDDRNPIQLHHVKSAQKIKTYPVIHRQYIYYLNDMKSLELFQENPLKYTQITKKYPIIAFRVAIIGPPKCGKSALAERYANEFGFQVVSRGAAIRYILQTLPYTLLACKIDNQLRKGEILDHCLVMEAVEVFCSKSAAVCQGIVFDGFPVFTEEMEFLFNIGLTPHLVINLEATIEFSRICLANHNLTRAFFYSEEFMQYRFCNWLGVENIQLWIHINFQNIYNLNCQFTNWSIWTRAKRLSLTVFKSITYHVKYFRCDKALILKHLSVTPHEMIQRLSSYKNYCICCWTIDHILYKSIIPIDRQHLVQFRNQYFFVCAYHLPTFLHNCVLYG